MKKWKHVALAAVVLLLIVVSAGITIRTVYFGGGWKENVFEPIENEQLQTQPSTVPVQTQPQQETTQPTQATQPTQNPSAGTTTPTTSTTPTTGEQPEVTVPDPQQSDFETYMAMTAAEKAAFRKTFESTDAFFAWYNQALADHKAANPPTQIGPDGTVELN